MPDSTDTLDRARVRARMDSIPEVLSPELIERMRDDRARGWVNPYRADDRDALRREDRPGDVASIWRPAYVRDVEKIIHTPAYNRGAACTSSSSPASRAISATRSVSTATSSRRSASVTTWGTRPSGTPASAA